MHTPMNFQTIHILYIHEFSPKAAHACWCRWLDLGQCAPGNQLSSSVAGAGAWANRLYFSTAGDLSIATSLIKTVKAHSGCLCSSKRSV